MGKKLKVLQVFNTPYAVARGYDFKEEFADPENMYTENDVYQALKANGFDVRLLGLYDDIKPLLEEVADFKPDIIFNLVEVFKDKSQFEKNFGSILEILGIPYTGASADALFICNNKALAKKILRFHRVFVPDFHTFYRGQRVWLPKGLQLPAIVKPLCEEASRGISQASVVDSEEAFIDRIRFIQDSMHEDVIAEEYIEGREFYVTLMGRRQLAVFPIRELNFGQLPDDEPRIATYRAKWDDSYRERWGIKSLYASKLPEGWEEKIREVCKRAYRALNFYSYVRFDVRVTEQGQVYIIEPNANPCIAKIDEVARSAEKMGVNYNELIRRITLLPLQYAVHRKKNGKGGRLKENLAAVS